ncbi:hypothetical protein [Variovorax sp. KK3]|uniref:hypothetical protein n=1 Tax=Variovorax sp. KK3 TaxID=1855728 RepID=UPI00117C0162|nr:hypothetical protein [Variovorax sp. KK3]
MIDPSGAPHLGEQAGEQSTVGGHHCQAGQGAGRRRDGREGAEVESEAAYRAIAASILSARQAAEYLFATTERGYQRQIAGLGQGNKFRDYMSSLQQIEEQFAQRRQELQNQRAQAELNAGGKLTAEAAAHTTPC